MEKFVFFLLLLLIQQVTIRILSDHLEPPTIRFVFFFRRMSAATTKRIMLHFHSLFSLFKSLFHFFTTKYIPVKVFAKYLSGLIFNGVFRIDGYDKAYPHLEKGLTNPFRIARINKNNFR
jgi:hypothetical protein